MLIVLKSEAGNDVGINPKEVESVQGTPQGSVAHMKSGKTVELRDSVESVVEQLRVED